jgi:molecular chaperone DnaK (HSP70)
MRRPASYINLEAPDGTFFPMIPTSAGPHRRTQSITTAVDNQTRLEIHVSERATDNLRLGKLELTGITPAPKGVVDIEVTLAIDAYGTVSVSAQELPNGPRNSTTLRMLPAPEEARPGVGYLDTGEELIEIDDPEMLEYLKSLYKSGKSAKKRKKKDKWSAVLMYLRRLFKGARDER